MKTLSRLLILLALIALLAPRAGAGSAAEARKRAEKLPPPREAGAPGRIPAGAAGGGDRASGPEGRPAGGQTGGQTGGLVLRPPPEPVRRSEPPAGAPLIPWRWVLLAGIGGYAGIRLLEWHLKRRALARLHESGGASGKGPATARADAPAPGPGAAHPTGEAWARGLPARQRQRARSLPPSGQSRMRSGDPCPRCGGPVSRVVIAPAPVLKPRRIRESCGRCTWLAEKVALPPRKGRLGAEARTAPTGRETGGRPHGKGATTWI